MKTLLDWIDQRTGLPTAAAEWLKRPMAGGPAWRFVWPSTIVFTLITQTITGVVLWMYYSPSTQSAWESVYYLQYQVQGGWLLRAIHHYTAQVMLVLVGVYLLQIIVRGVYRAPREFQFWTVLLMGMVVLGLNLTGDLLPWDQNGYHSTKVRTGFLLLLPGVGSGLQKLAIGGPQFGQLTLTRFITYHAGLLSAALVALAALHAWLARRHGLEAPLDQGRADPYWPRQALRDMLACTAVLAVILALSLQNGVTGDEAGVALGAPASEVESYDAARPEWSFRGLYQMTHSFPAQWQIVPVFGISGLVVAVFLLMPLIGKSDAGRWFNVGFTAAVLLGLVVLSWQSFAHDAQDEKHQQALEAGRQQAGRVRELAEAYQIPPTGAATLLANDPKTQGPKLFAQCAGCHPYTDAEGNGPKPEKPTAPNLHGFAGRAWLKGFLDPKGIAGPEYFGNTKFAKGQMVSQVKEMQKLVAEGDLDPKDIERGCIALSAEAGLKGQRDLDARDAAAIQEGRKLLTSTLGCRNCHKFDGKGGIKGPQLTGYGSRQWLREIVANPAHPRFYGTRNDRMPGYAESLTNPDAKPDKDLLSQRELGLLVDWLRGEWYEQGEE